MIKHFTHDQYAKQEATAHVAMSASLKRVRAAVAAVDSTAVIRVWQDQITVECAADKQEACQKALRDALTWVRVKP